MSKILLINCCSDDRYAKTSRYLLDSKKEHILKGIKSIAEGLGQPEVMVLLPKDYAVEFPSEYQVYFGEESQITANPYAALEVIKGKLPRPMMVEEPAIFNNQEVLMITPLDAYEVARKSLDEAITRFLTIHGQQKTQVVEVPVPMSLFEVFDNHKIDLQQVKGILLGGLRGRFLSLSELSSYHVEEEQSYDSVTLYYKENCMVEELRNLSHQIQTTSCGKCVLCREGSLQYATILEEMTAGKAKMTDLDLLKEISELIEIGAYCTFGNAMSRVITSGITLFYEEFEAHIRKRSCPSGVCKAFGSYCILPKLCTGCEDCLDSCPEDAIIGKCGFIHMIDEDLCEKCGKCVPACDEQAIILVTGTKPKVPQKLTKVGKF